MLQKLSRSTLTVLTVSVIFQYTITTNSFENDVLHADKPVLVDFWVQWCPYCRRIAPAFDKVGEQYADTLITGKINYDEEPQLIERFGIDTIPTLMLFKSG